MATPVHGLSLLIWTKDSKKYTRIAPTGVAALKTATCLRQSGRGSPVARRDVVRANTVGAMLQCEQFAFFLGSYVWGKCRLTFVDYQGQKDGD